MITKTAHIILLFTLLLSSLCSCQSNEDIEQFIQQPKPVLLDLNVMLAAPHCQQLYRTFDPDRKSVV